MNFFITIIILTHLFYEALSNNEEEESNEFEKVKLEDYDGNTETNSTVPKQLGLSPFRSCVWSSKMCERCEVCVEGQCLPYVVNQMYRLTDQGECRLKDYCRESRVTCPRLCRQTYGNYFCDCRKKFRYGQTCNTIMKDKENVPLRKIHVIYPAAMKAEGSYDMDIPKDERSIMVSWQAETALSNSVSVEYMVIYEEFSDVRTFTHGELDLNPVRTCNNIISDEEACKQYFRNESCYSLVFSTRFPFLPMSFKETLGGIKFVSLNLSGKGLIGYELKFIIIIRVGSMFLQTEHDLFVYYNEVSYYLESDCFPVQIQPTSCADHWNITSTNYPSHRKSISEDGVISATATAKSAQDDKQTDCVFDYDFFLIKDGPNLDPDSKTYWSSKTSDILTLKPFELDIGQYRIEVQARLSDNPNLANFAVCFLEVYREPLKAVIQGGDSRTVYANEDLVMDATGSEDPNNPRQRQTNLLFTWSCNKPDNFCKVYKTKARRYVIKAPIRPGITFDFKLEVSAFNQSRVIATQRVITTADKFASFSIICRKNCGEDDSGSNPRKIIYLETIVKGKEYLEDDKFKWSYNYSDVDLRENNGLLPIERIMPKNLTSNICIILPDFLYQGKYTFTAQRVKTKGTASYSITIGANPIESSQCFLVEENKTFRIKKPNKSFEQTRYILKPKYNVQCQNFRQNVNYSFYLSDGGENNLPIYFINTNEKSANNVYNYKTMYKDNKQRFKVKIYDQSGHYSIIDVSNQDEKELSVIDLPGQRESQDYKHELTWDWVFVWVSERQQFLKRNPVQSEVLEYFNTLLSLASIDKSRKNKRIKETLFVKFYELFGELSFENYYDLMSVLSSLARFMHTLKIPALGNNPKFNSVILAAARQLKLMIDSYGDYAQFFDYDKMISTHEFIGISKSLFDCLRFMFDSLSNTQNISESMTQNQKTMPGLFDKRFHNKEILSSTRDRTGQYGNIQMNEYENLKILTELLILSLKSYLNALKERILPMENFEGQYGLTLFKGKHAVSVMIDSPMNFPKFQKLPHKAEHSFISVSNVLASELYELSPYIAIKMAFLNSNPYWWDLDESKISSQILFAEIWQREEDDSWTSIVSTKNILDVHLSLNQRQNTTVQGEAILVSPEADEITKERSVTVFRVWPPLYGGGGTLFVQFVGLDRSDSLRVALRDDFHPDFNYMNTYAKTVDDENSEVTLTYNLKGRNSFLYIGIIPGPLFKPKDLKVPSLTFRFEVYIVRCLMRKHSMWLAKYCYVNTENDEKDLSRTHCLCNEFTGMIAAAIVAPKVKLQPFLMWLFDRYEEVNYIPLVSIVVFLLMFLIFLFWAHYRDRNNLPKRKVIVLDDNFPGEDWPYLVGVYTGTRPWSGTDANVGIQLFGELAKSRTHILRSSERQTHSSYSDDWFLLFSPKYIGKITKMHIWMDYAEKGADWYCRKIIVYDFTTKEIYVFRLSCWFYISLYSELLNVYLAPEKSGKRSVKHMLGDNFASYFQEQHYAISTIHHHPRSLMSGAEIVATFWSTIIVSVLLFLLFYKYDYSGTEDYPYFHLTETDFLVALIGHIPSVAVSLVGKILFRRKFVTRDLKTWKSITQKLQNLEKSYIEGPLTGNENNPAVKESKDIHKSQKTNSEEHISKTKTPYQYPITLAEGPAENMKISNSRKYTAWIVVVLALLGMSLGVVIEGLSMSKTKSQIWLCVCFIAMFIGLFISNTIRVVVHALVATFIWKKQFDEPVISCDPTQGMRMDKVGDEEYLNQILKMRSKSEYYPPKPHKIEEIRSQMKSKVLLTSLLELSTIILIYLLVVFGTMTSWGTVDFHHKNHLNYILKDANLDKRFMGVYSDGLKHLQDLEQLKKYFTSTISYVYGSTEWYNSMSLTFEDDKFPETGWLMDYVHRMIGVIQIRQKLVKTEDCMNPKFKEKFAPVICCPLLTKKNEDRQNYSVGWSLENVATTSDSESQWQYQEPDQPFLSWYSEDGRYFSGGGYVLNLGRTKKETSSILRRMNEADWFTRRVEVIFIDSCIYNVNVNKLSIITVSLELGRTYGLHKRVQIVNIEVPYGVLGFNFLFWIFLGVVLAALIGYVAFMIFEYGLEFFYSFWNVVDFCIMVFFGVCYAYGLTNEFRTTFSIGDNLNTGQDKFFFYGWVNYHGEYYYFMFIILTLLTTIKLFKYFRNTLQIDPIVRTIFSSGFYLSRITLICLPLLYFKFYIVDCLLFNTQQPSHRLPLVNKIGLKNYAQHYVFPDDKFVPYLFCQFCTMLIALFSILIVHHYKISKNSVFFPTYDIDIFVFCKGMMRDCWWKRKKRLRSGAEMCNRKSSHPSTKIKASFMKVVGEKDKISCLKNNNPDMSIVYKNMETKLDKIKDTLIFFSENLED